MGRPKAWLPGPTGRPLIEEALAALSAAGLGPLLVACRDPAPFAPLAAEPLVDSRPGLGPLAGLESLLDRSPTEWVLVVACDMPHLDPAVLSELAGRARRSERAAVLPRVEGRLQPFPGVYHRRALPAIRAALDADRLRLMALVPELDPEQVDFPPGPCFSNVNTPEDLRT